MAAKTISFSIYKGGTGKTTSTVNTGAALAEMGKRVLVVDLDQQASATRYLGVDPDKPQYTLYHVYAQNVPASVVKLTTKFGVDLIPSSGLMAAIEASLEDGDETMLRDKIGGLRDEYDFILIDTPPGKADLAFNGIVAADLLLIPASAERMSVDGISDLINHVQGTFWNEFKSVLRDQELRILFTMYRANTKHSPGVVQAAERIYRDTVLKILIPETVEFPRSFDLKQPITHSAPRHPGAAAYRELAKWLVNNAQSTA